MLNPDFNRARDFIYSNARLIERHLFSFQFEDGAADMVERALSGYQHANRLFGFGLEPDKRASAPQPVDQAIAMEILDAMGASRGRFEAICVSLRHLTNADGGLPFSHQSVEAAPHAAWWAWASS